LPGLPSAFSHSSAIRWAGLRRLPVSRSGGGEFSSLLAPIQAQRLGARPFAAESRSTDFSARWPGRYFGQASRARTLTSATMRRVALVRNPKLGQFLALQMPT
jgi:hypothetical protein